MNSEHNTNLSVNGNTASVSRFSGVVLGTFLVPSATFFLLSALALPDTTRSAQ